MLGKSSAPRHSSQSRGKSWQTGCLRRSRFCASPAGTFPKLLKDVSGDSRRFCATKVRTLAGDEGDEFADALLHALLGFLRDLRILRQGGLHDAGHWSKIMNVSIVVARHLARLFLGEVRGRLGRRRLRGG